MLSIKGIVRRTSRQVSFYCCDLRQGISPKMFFRCFLVEVSWQIN